MVKTASSVNGKLRALPVSAYPALSSAGAYASTSTRRPRRARWQYGHLSDR